ncbi:hypothetical protein Tco_0115569 [Tanacetum coccineum]
MIDRDFRHSKADTKEPPSYTKGEHVTIEDDTKKAKSDKAKEEPTRAVPISTIRPITRPNPEVALIETSSRLPLTYHILEIHEETGKIGLNPKTIVSAKAGGKFKKARDTEHQVLKREHLQKVKRLMELNKKRAKQHIVTKLDELGQIIQKKKNTIVKDLMISLRKRYERLKKIPGELHPNP